MERWNDFVLTVLPILFVLSLLLNVWLALWRRAVRRLAMKGWVFSIYDPMYDGWKELRAQAKDEGKKRGLFNGWRRQRELEKIERYNLPNPKLGGFAE